MEWFCIWNILKGGSSIATSMVLEESLDRMLYYCITNYYILLPCLLWLLYLYWFWIVLTMDIVLKYWSNKKHNSFIHSFILTCWNVHNVHIIIALCTNLKPFSGWLFPIQLENIHICENAYFLKGDILQSSIYSSAFSFGQLNEQIRVISRYINIYF